MSTSLSSRPPLSRRARRLAAGALVVIALPVAGCGGGGSSSGGGDGDADPAAVVPAGAAAYAEVTVRPEGNLKASVETLAKKIAKTNDPGARIVSLIDNELKEDGQSYAKDIEPWLGKKAGVAITGLKNPESPDYAIIVAATDPKKALAALKKGAKNVDERKYKDTDYSYSSDEEQAAIATDGTLTIGTEAAIKSVIDVKKGADSLAKSEKLKQARASVSDDRLGFFYADPLAVIDLVANSTPEFGAQAGQLKSLLGGGKSAALGAALTTAPDAIRLQTAFDGLQDIGGGGAAETLAGLPSGSVLGVGFGNIGGAAKQAVGQLSQLGGIYSGILGQFQAITGLDVEQDVLSWMGKGGLFVRLKGVTDVGGAVVIDTSSEQKTTQVISTTRRLLTQFVGSSVRVKSYNAGGAKGFQAEAEGFPFPIIVATGSGKFVVAVGASSVAEALKPTATLGEDPQFKATATKLGAKPQVYVDFTTIVGFLDLVLGDDADFKAAKPYLAAFTALAAGTEQKGKKTEANLVVGVK